MIFDTLNMPIFFTVVKFSYISNKSTLVLILQQTPTKFNLLFSFYFSHDAAVFCKVYERTKQT